MRTMALLACLALPASAAAQATAAAPAFDVASVKASRQMLGPDYNNQLSYSPIGITARNATLKRLVAEAYRVQLDQVAGPGWLDRDEYDIDARATKECFGWAYLLASMVRCIKQRSTWLHHQHFNHQLEVAGWPHQVGTIKTVDDLTFISSSQLQYTNHQGPGAPNGRRSQRLEATGPVQSSCRHRPTVFFSNVTTSS